MLLELGELALLQANVQVDQVLSGRGPKARPLLRHVVGVLDRVVITTEERSAGYSVCSEEDCKQGGGSDNLHDEMSIQ